MKDKIPFNFFPENALRELALKWIQTGKALEQGFPKLKIELMQAGIEYSAEEYLGIASLLVTVYTGIFAVLFTIGLWFMGSSQWILGIPAVIVLAFLVGIQIILFPKILIKRKIRDIEQNLIYAVRTLLVQVKAG